MVGAAVGGEVGAAVGGAVGAGVGGAVGADVTNVAIAFGDSWFAVSPWPSLPDHPFPNDIADPSFITHTV